MKNVIRKQEMVAIRDAVTGEMENAKVTVIVARDRPKYREPFTLMFQAVNVAIAKEIKPVTARVLLYLTAIAQYGNIIDRTTTELAEELDYEKRQIQRAIKELESLRILVRMPNPNDKRKTLLHLNPLQSWKGNYRERHKAISALADKNQLELNFVNPGEITSTHSAHN